MRQSAADRVEAFRQRFVAAPGTRERTEVIAAAAPGIIANPYTPHFPHPKQLAGLVAAENHDDKRGPFEILFGGAMGGGKTDWVLQACSARAAVWTHYRAVVLRRTHAEMMKAGAILSRAMRWWLPRGAAWDGTNKIFRFPSGATVEFGYHDHPTHDAKYQGGEWHDAFFDELTHWPDENAFEWLRSRLRTGDRDPVTRRLMATSNPGGPGHDWVKKRFVGGQDITGKIIVPRSYYLPSRIEDNPSLDREAYVATLQDMHPTRRAQLLDGDWSAREPGDYFRLEWFGPLLDAPPAQEFVAIRWWDLAASEREDAARTAGVRMLRLASGVRVVTHATAFRATPGKRDSRIVQQAKIDGRSTIVGIEIEGGSGGIAQFDALASRLRADGFRVVGARPTAKQPDQSDAERVALSINTPSDKGKTARADPVASCLERGYQRRGECDDTGGPWWGADIGKPVTEQRDGIRLVAGEWTQGYLDELEGFPEATLKDLVDATSGAWAWLQAHPYGRSVAPQVDRPKLVLSTTHPEDRPEDDGGRSSTGHWQP